MGTHHCTSVSAVVPVPGYSEGSFSTPQSAGFDMENFCVSCEGGLPHVTRICEVVLKTGGSLMVFYFFFSVKMFKNKEFPFCMLSCCCSWWRRQTEGSNLACLLDLSLSQECFITGLNGKLFFPPSQILSTRSCLPL